MNRFMSAMVSGLAGLIGFTDVELKRTDKKTRLKQRRGSGVYMETKGKRHRSMKSRGNRRKAMRRRA
ncbi:hypothetical protein [Hydrogenimonas sp.]